MALSLLTTPQALSPAYNPLLFTFSSTNYTKTGFRYIVDVYDANTSTLVTRQKVASQPNGNGKIDISRIVSNYVDVDFTGTTDSLVNATNSYFKYNAKLGEEYRPDDITSNGSSSASGGTHTTINLLSTHTFEVNDQVIITSSNPNINGLFIVTNIPSSTSFTISVPFTVSSTSTVNYSDGRKVIFSGLVTSTGYTVFNGAKSFDDFISYSGSEYTLSGSSTTKKLLTNQPNTFYATPSQEMWLNANIISEFDYSYGISGVTNVGTTFVQYSEAPNVQTNRTLQFNIGSQALSVPTTNLIYYDICVYRGKPLESYQQISKTYRIYLDNRCNINEYQIAFMDRMGSIGSFAFQLRSKETGNITRTQYKAQVPQTYTTEDRGTKNIFIGLEKSYELNTNWMTDDMSVYFEELLSSPYQWVKLEDGKYHACVVTETSFEVERQRNKKLIRKTVTIKLANDSNINC